MPAPKSIRITDVGPRDGLQNETAIISAQDKIRFIDLLSHSGVTEIEVTSFVNPRWVPQLADAAEVMSSIYRSDDVCYSVLVPNERGMERALDCAPDKVAVFTAASETFSQKNTNASIAQTIERFKPVVETARRQSIPVRGYVSCAVACPYEGPIDPDAVAAVVNQLLDIGVNEIDLGETIGVAVPTDIEALYEAVSTHVPPSDTTLHLHNTRGTALACADRAIQLGVRSFDSSCIGLGGCPFAPGAAGNLATEDLAYYCARMNIDTGIVPEALYAAGRHIAAVLGRPAASSVFRADGASADSCSE